MKSEFFSILKVTGIALYSLSTNKILLVDVRLQMHIEKNPSFLRKSC